MKISVENLSLSFKQSKSSVNAIDNISFSIKPGEVFALLGESGCGKSLTASAMMQLLPNNAFYHRSSKILFDDNNLLEFSEQKMQTYRGIKMSMIFQEPMRSLNPVLTIFQQLAEILRRCYTKNIKAKAIELLNKVEIKTAEERINDYPHQFSGGEKQRIMIAMAIASKVELLIADEPTTALDVTVQAQILILLKKLTSEYGMAMLLISHDLGIVKQISDSVAIMYAGQIVECCSTQAFFSGAKHPYSKRLLKCLPKLSLRGLRLEPILGIVPSLDEMPAGCRFKERCLIAKDKCAQLPNLVGDLNHQVRCHFHEQSEETALIKLPSDSIVLTEQTEVLGVSDLKIHYPIYKGIIKREVDSIKAVNGVSFSLKKGETLALVGESGCGKTTLSRGICQLIPITSGEIRLHNQPVYKHTKSITSELQIIFQDPFSSMNPRMLIQDILLEGLISQSKCLTQEAAQKKAKKLLELVGMPSNSISRYPHEFSGGQRQRISIARALAVNPSVIICDEPTSALDVSVQSQLLNLLLELQAELSLSYLFISHDLAVVSYMSDNIMVMNQGAIVEKGKANDIITRPKHPYTKELMSAVF